MRNIRRMWVNQPSTLQPDHALHGTRVLADLDDKTWDHSTQVFFIEGPVHSAVLLTSSLSDGGPAWGNICS